MPPFKSRPESRVEICRQQMRTSQKERGHKYADSR